MSITNEQYSIHIKQNKVTTNDDDRRAKRIIQKMQAFGLFRKDMIGATYERATTCRDLEQAFRLVHDVYVDAGYIRPQAHGIRMRHFECSPDTATFTAQAASHGTIGVMSVVMDSDDFGLPSDHIYKDEIDKLRANGSTICEFSNQAVLKEFRRKGPSTELMRCAFAHAYAKGVTDIVFSVSPNVVSFYEMMHFQRFGETRNYSTTLNDPVVLIHVPDIQTRGAYSERSDDPAYRFFMKFFYQENPYIKRFHSWEILNQRMFNDQFEFATLLCKCPDLVYDSRYENGLEKRLGEIYSLTKDAISVSSNTQSSVHDKEQTSLHRRPFRTIMSHSIRSNVGHTQRRIIPSMIHPRENGRVAGYNASNKLIHDSPSPNDIPNLIDG